MMRNPKDCLTSMFGFMSKHMGIEEWNDVFDEFLSQDSKLTPTSGFDSLKPRRGVAVDCLHSSQTKNLRLGSDL